MFNISCVVLTKRPTPLIISVEKCMKTRALHFYSSVFPIITYSKLFVGRIWYRFPPCFRPEGSETCAINPVIPLLLVPFYIISSSPLLLPGWRKSSCVITLHPPTSILHCVSGIDAVLLSRHLMSQHSLQRVRCFVIPYPTSGSKRSNSNGLNVQHHPQMRNKLHPAQQLTSHSLRASLSQSKAQNLTHRSRVRDSFPQKHSECTKVIRLRGKKKPWLWEIGVLWLPPSSSIFSRHNFKLFMTSFLWLAKFAFFLPKDDCYIFLI